MLPCESGVFTWRRAEYVVSTDRSRLDLDAIHSFLARESHWSRGIDRTVLERGIAGSLPFGLYGLDGVQAGFGRLVTDCGMFAYLRDMFVLPEHRGRGLSLFLLDCICAHPDLATVHNWMLATEDAHALYAKVGFAGVDAGRYMRRLVRRPAGEQ